ncbi:MAG: DUF4406 domain-containing protein [Coriobacteriaceae bacterium]|jgi:hypothetical protein|nr:DUF4406 domain-containing protein [Coriobacteriaceae bacterium]
MRVYVCGPVTGIPGGNRPQFDFVAEQLRTEGHEPVVPHDHVDPSWPWGRCMRALIPVMLSCDAVVTLLGWSRSKGAGLEVHISSALGIETMPAKEFLDSHPGGAGGTA